MKGSAFNPVSIKESVDKYNAKGRYFRQMRMMNSPGPKIGRLQQNLSQMNSLLDQTSSASKDEEMLALDNP